MEQGYLYLWTLPDKRTQWFAVSDTAAMQQAAQQAAGQGRDVYYGVGISGAAKTKGRASTADITGIPGVWMDLDLRDAAAHKQSELPETLEEIQGKLPLEATVVVHSGHGVHLYWLFREVWVFDGPEDKKRAEGLLQGFQRYVRQRLGYKLDATHDLARVFRLPGTVNYKDKATPKQVCVIAQSGIRYSYDDLDQFTVETSLQPAAASGDQPAPAARKQGGFVRKETDGPAALAIANCAFLQYCELQAATLPEPWWVAMLSNVARCADGEAAAHELSAPYPGYNPAETDAKIAHVLAEMGPQTCQYIKNTLGFKGCPKECSVKAPCCWAVEEMPRAVARLRSIACPTPEIAFSDQVLGDLALLQSKNVAEFSKISAKWKGHVNLVNLQKSIKEERLKQFKQHNLKVVEGGAGGKFAGPRERKTNFFVRDTPLSLRIPDGFEYGIDGVQEVKLDAMTGNPVYHTAAWTPTIISAHIENVDAQSEKLELAFKVHGKWRKAICKRSDAYIARNLALLSDAGLGVSSETARYLVKYLQALETENVIDIPRKKAVSKLGWRDGEQVFVLPGIKSDYELDLGGMESKVAGFKAAGDFAKWLAVMRKVRSRDKARLILAASFAAPLLKVLNQRSFAIHNWDNTRGGKTATQHAALSVWGKPGELARTFDDTRTSLERTAALYTDLPLGINEYELLSNKKKENIDSMIYQICEGQGRGRGTVTGLQETAVWRTVAITNGESQIIQDCTKGGVFTRLIELKGGPLVDDDMFASSLYGFTTKHHGHAGKLFIEKLLAADHEEIRARYERVRQEFRRDFAENIPSHLDIMACLTVADYYSSGWVFGIAAPDAKRQAQELARKVIPSLVTQSEADESVRAWEWLPDWIAMNIGKISGAPSVSYENYGCSDGDYYYIIKNVLKNALKQQGFNADKVFSAWADQGKIPYTTDKRGKRIFGIKSGTPYQEGQTRPWLIRIPREEPKEEREATSTMSNW